MRRAHPEQNSGRKSGSIMTTHAGLVGFYNYPLVALSIFIAILSAYAALDLAGRVTTARGAGKLAWLGGGAIAMGSGIWAMHYVGMEAFRLPVPVLYDWPTVLLSLFAAILASAIALYIASRPTLGLLHSLAGSIFMGSGIAAMHYIGMEAMRLPAMCVYSPGLVILSISLAIAISYIALRLTFELRDDLSSWSLRKAGAALIMGVAIPVMHYVGMAAVVFVSTATVEGSLRHAINVSNLSLAGIVLVTLMLLAIVFISSSVDRQLSAQAGKLEDNFLQLQAVFDNMTDAIVVADFEAKTLLHNQAAIHLLGVNKKLVSFEEVGASFEIFLPNGAPVSFEQSPLMRAALGDYCSNTEMVFRRKDVGVSVTTEITTVPLSDSGSKGSKAILSIRDVGERVLAEELIRRQKTQLQNVFDNLNEGIMLMDMDRNIVQINRAASRLLGIPSATFSREKIMQVFEVMLPNGEPIPHDKWPSALAYNGEFIQNREFRVRRTDTGHAILAQISTAPVFDSSGELMQIIFSYRDITKTKEADEMRRRLSAIIDFSEDAIIGKDEKGIVTSWNAGAAKVFGYSANEMIGQSIKILLPNDRTNEEADILARIKDGEIVDNFETIRIRKDGQFINVSLTISPIRDAGGLVIGASKIARDITDRKKLENQLQQSQKMDAIGQLTGGIAHDFNNLLGVVIGNLDLIKRSVDKDDKAAHRLQTAQKAALRGADLTRRLLAFSCNVTLSPVPTQLNHLIRNVTEMTDRLVGPEIKITTGFNDSIPAILVDAAGLESALVNLVVNARDAMPKGGTITISTQINNIEADYPPVQAGELKTGSYACISVSDTGHGMSRQTLARVFEPFFTTKALGKGTGLGLAMVYGFAKQSKGAVRIYSELNLGTTVNLYLPFGNIAKVVAPKAVEPTEHLPNKVTVLVVDDEVELLDIATAYLEEMGCKVYSAVDGNSAIRVMEQQKDIDLIVTDIVMPGGMNGVELAEKVRLLNPRTKVIFCSGFPAGALAERSILAVDGPLLNKPYQRNEFTVLVRRIMATDNKQQRSDALGTLRA